MSQFTPNYLDLGAAGPSFLELSEVLEEASFHGECPGPLGNITTDSRVCNDTSLFCALRGSSMDGHHFIPAAIKAGCRAVLSEIPFQSPVPLIVVPDTRATLIELAQTFSPVNFNETKVIGVTGTNGKTTTTHLILQLLELLGVRAASVGTLGVRYSGNVKDAPHTITATTTPDPLLMQAVLGDCNARKIACAAVEVSSHALVQQRVQGVEFACKVFTNLTQDHLDYHGGMKEYRDAKFQLFLQSPENPAVICADDVVGQHYCRLLMEQDSPYLTYGFAHDADWRILQIEKTKSEQIIHFSAYGLGRFSVRSPLLGQYNANNLLAALASCVALGYDLESLIEVAPGIGQAPGRLERFESRDGVLAFVDYAHTPDAVSNVLSAAQQVCKGKLWVVLGCGGDRDRTKRPKMLAAACASGDRVVVTMDNPRTEDPEQIISDMLSTGLEPVLVQPDREKAICYALHSAAPGDVVVVAGKGHEDYQIIGTEKRYFSDQAVIIKGFEERDKSVANY